MNIWGMPSLTQFTVCFWMKKNGISGSGTVFLYGGVPGQSTTIWIAHNSKGFLNFQINNSAGYILHMTKMK